MKLNITAAMQVNYSSEIVKTPNRTTGYFYGNNVSLMPIQILFFFGVVVLNFSAENRSLFGFQESLVWPSQFTFNWQGIINVQWTHSSRFTEHCDFKVFFFYLCKEKTKNGLDSFGEDMDDSLPDSPERKLEMKSWSIALHPMCVMIDFMAEVCGRGLIHSESFWRDQEEALNRQGRQLCRTESAKRRLGIYATWRWK